MLLVTMLERLGCEVLDMGVVRDQPQALEAALLAAAACSDGFHDRVPVRRHGAARQRRRRAGCAHFDQRELGEEE